MTNHYPIDIQLNRHYDSGSMTLCQFIIRQMI